MRKREELPRRRLREKSLIEMLNYAALWNELMEMAETAADIEYAWDEDNILNALDGDEEMVWEMKLAYAGLSDECDRIQSMRDYEYVFSNENFDLLMKAVSARFPDEYRMLQYDEDEEDYFPMSEYAAYAEREACIVKLKRMTKDELLNLVENSLAFVLHYLDIKDRITALNSVVEIIQDENGAILQAVKDIEQQYILADRVGFNRKDKATQKYDELLTHIPDKLWVE